MFFERQSILPHAQSVEPRRSVSGEGLPGMNRSRQQSRYVVGGGWLEALLVRVMGGCRRKEKMEHMIMLSVNAVIVVEHMIMNIIMKIINIFNHSKTLCR